MKKKIEQESALIKKPYTKTAFKSDAELLEFMACSDDPLYFMKFLKVQHPTKGAIQFKPYEYQKRMIKAFHDHRFVVAMCARQLGKSYTFKTYIKKDGKPTKGGTLIHLGWKDAIINWLENILLMLV